MPEILFLLIAQELGHVVTLPNPLVYISNCRLARLSVSNMGLRVVVGQVVRIRHYNLLIPARFDEGRGVRTFLHRLDYLFRIFD
jgi:hypothetical protein